MEYELDLDVGHLLQWLRDDRLAGSRENLRVRATREYEVEAVADADGAGIGEDQDIAVPTTIGMLELWPGEMQDPWRLRVRITDAAGSHLPEDESVPDDAEEIDIEAFYRDFVAPDTGAVSVSLSSETPAGKQSFDRLMSKILTDRHSG